MSFSLKCFFQQLKYILGTFERKKKIFFFNVYVCKLRLNNQACNEFAAKSDTKTC